MPLRSVKKKLNAHVKTLARMVDSDWHDGYEEQGEECMEWIASCGALVESALRVGVAFGCCHELGHAVLMCAAALPMGGAPAMKGAGGTRTALSALPLAATAWAPRGRAHWPGSDSAARHGCTGTSRTPGPRSRRSPSGATPESASPMARGKRAPRSRSISSRATRAPSTPATRPPPSARSRGRCCSARRPPRPRWPTRRCCAWSRTRSTTA